MAEGIPYEEINREAERGEYDLVVMGTHGRTGIRHALLGSVAEKVIQTGHCPVLVVHPRRAAA
jgi:glycine betaine transporter